jgi:hypothetical protein
VSGEYGLNNMCILISFMKRYDRDENKEMIEVREMRAKE